MKKDKNNITLSFKNIIWFLNNLTSHFTGKEKIITLSLIILMLSLINITLGSSNNSNSVLSLFGLSTSSVSALSYESNVGIGFSFNPTLSVSFSSSDLAISNLTPGTTSDSNDIVVSVSTNASHGYTLAVNTNSDNLVHSNNSNVFSSIGTDANIESLTSDNTWGYSYKLSSDTTWSNYSGLSSSTTKTLVNTDNQSSKPIDFKIGAKASTTQASGEYTNIINFIAVSKPIPKTIDDIVYMQTFGELVPTDLQSVKNSMVKNTTYTLKDARDEQEYTVAKLEDDKIWMTKNLNLAGGTKLSSDTTDFDSYYTIPNTQGWQANGTLPESSTGGFSNSNYAYVYNSDNYTCDSVNPCYSYYSWDAITLGSGRNINTANIDAPYSICPKGWKLPTSRTSAATNWQTESDFYQLAVSYGMDPESTLDSASNFSNNTGNGTTPNFLATGFYASGLFYLASNSFYWSSTSDSGTNSESLYFFSSYIDSARSISRAIGSATRCVAR